MEMRLHAALSGDWSVSEAVQGMLQVMRRLPELEKRLLTLLCKRILPVALKSLRLWRKGDLCCHRPAAHMPHTL